MSRRIIDEDDYTHTNSFFRAWDVETDGRVYGSLNDYEFINLPVGRIMGVSTSDTAGYIARDIFFDQLPKNKDALLVIREDHQDEIYKICSELNINNQECCKDEQVLEEYARRYFWTDEIRNQFDQEFFYSGDKKVQEKQEEIYEKYDNVYLNLFDDHGWFGGFSGMMDSDYLINNKVYLKPSFVIGLACSTCLYDSYSTQGYLFCVQGIRRGALAQQGAVAISYWHQEFDDILEGTILQDKTIGKAYMEARNEEYQINHYNFFRGLRGDPFYVLLGDPTWKPKWW